MMARKISVDDLAEMISKTMAEYSEETAQLLEAECKQIAKEAVKKLTIESPQQTGKYAKGWKVYVAFRSLTAFRYVICNKKRYQLTHLLENSHVIKNGTKRVYGKTEGIPHIRPVKEWIERELNGRVKVKVRQKLWNL